MVPLRPVPLVVQPTALVQLLVKHRVTHLVAVPSVLQLWLPTLLSHKELLNLKQLVSSGEMLSADLAGQLLDVLPAGCVLLNLYGVAAGYLHSSRHQTEAGPAGSTAVAAALPFQKLQLVGSVPDRQQLEAHAAADSTSCHLKAEELTARGPDMTGLSVAAGQGLDVTSFASRPQRWFKTGDVGKLNSEGVLQLLGRRSQLVKIRGMRVDLLEVEAVLTAVKGAQAGGHAAAAVSPHSEVAVMRAMLEALTAPPAAVRLLEPAEDFFTAGSARVAFASTARLAIVALLDGSVVAFKTGWLYSVRSEDGRMVWARHISSSSITAAPAATISLTAVPDVDLL
eukprot:gene11164-11314_t